MALAHTESALRSREMRADSEGARSTGSEGALVVIECARGTSYCRRFTYPNFLRLGTVPPAYESTEL